MKRFVMAAVGAAALSFSLATPTMADVVVYTQTGTSDSVSLMGFGLDGPGTYDVHFESSDGVSLHFNSYYNHHVDVFYAPPPRPHDQNLWGSNSSISVSSVSTFDNEHVFTFVVPETNYTFFEKQPGSPFYNVLPTVPDGSLLYTEEKFENPYLNFLGSSALAEPFDYTLTITRRDAPVPEPAAWALMILGFGAVGGAMRARRRDMAAA
jgi:hypothetical protein